MIWGFAGDVFTWRNKQTNGSNHIRERLDRATVNAEWRKKFPLVFVKNGDTFHSYHRPVVIITERPLKSSLARGSNLFKFEANCLRKECRRVVEKAWGLVDNLGSNIICNLEGVLSSLKEWS